MPRIIARADQAPEGLRKPGANDAVVIALGATSLLRGGGAAGAVEDGGAGPCLLYTSPSPRD